MEKGSRDLLTCFAGMMKDHDELDKKYELENIARRIRETKEMVKVLLD